MKLWGVAIEWLRQEREISIGEMCRRVGMERSQYFRIYYTTKKGPTLHVLNRFLVAHDCTWAEWGQTYDTLVQVRGGTRPGEAV